MAPNVPLFHDLEQDNVFVRIRGTFIDVAPDACKAPQMFRSNSLPPRALVSGGADESHAYLTSWVERASRLPRSQMSAQENTQCCGNESYCACGAAYFPGARFCVGCGSARQSAIAGPKCGKILTGLKLTSILEPSHGEDMFGHSDSRETLHSIGSGAHETASTASTGEVKDTSVAPHAKWSGLASALACPEELHPITTLMICDLPCRQSIHQLIEVINELGFGNTYDLVYLPPGKRHQKAKHSQNIGYAFVNFKLAENAAAFCQTFQDFVFPHCESKKLSFAKPAFRQGYEANLQMHSKQLSGSCLLTFRDERMCISGP